MDYRDKTIIIREIRKWELKEEEEDKGENKTLEEGVFLEKIVKEEVLKKDTEGRNEKQEEEEVVKLKITGSIGKETAVEMLLINK